MKPATLFRLVMALGFLAALLFGIATIRHGFSAREQPSALESAIASKIRTIATPEAARNAKNPVAVTPEILTEARDHFADHCAICHGNDGSGNTTIGQNLYPKAPDMRLARTQNLTDGEIYYIIHNGIRLTGMPAWGADGNDQDSWKLVYFIRHLPQLTPAEVKEMETLNPKSAMDRQEEHDEEDFLNGKTVEKNEQHHH